MLVLYLRLLTCETVFRDATECFDNHQKTRSKPELTVAIPEMESSHTISLQRNFRPSQSNFLETRFYSGMLDVI